MNVLLKTRMTVTKVTIPVLRCHLLDMLPLGSILSLLHSEGIYEFKY